MKIVHAADLHLDSPMRGLSEYDGAPLFEVRAATRRALAGLVELCVEERAGLLLLAGDLYDGDFKDYSTALYFVEQMIRLRETGTRVVWVRGNHDAQNRITRHLRLPEGVFELSSDHPETRVFEELGVAVHGQGYATQAVLDNLAKGYPAPRAGLFNVGLLHTSLDGREGHASYAPTHVAELTARGYDYWALGHVHQREIVKAEVPIVFPGNLQGRHVRETGPKGATVLEVDGGKLVSFEHRSVDVVRWAVCDVDARELATLPEVVDAASQLVSEAQDAAEGRTLACRVRVVGSSRAHGELEARDQELLAELRRFSIERGGVYVERVEIKTTGELLLDSWSERGDALAGLFQSVRSLAGDEEAIEELRGRILGPLGGVSSELLREEAGDFREILREAESLLEGRLLEGKEPLE